MKALMRNSVNQHYCWICTPLQYLIFTRLPRTIMQPSILLKKILFVDGTFTSEALVFLP